METLQKKTLTTSRSLTYTYYVHPGSKSLPTVVLQHGFPDSAELWAGIIPLLIPTGYPLLVPDLLGYGGTSKPVDTNLYNSKAMAADLVEILDAEGIGSVISLGHDWGSYMAQRLYLWHPDRVVGIILLNVAYLPPDQQNPFDLEAVLQTQEKWVGRPLYAYWELFTSSEAAEVVGNRLESFYTVMHGKELGWMSKLWCHRGAMREYLEEDKRVEVKEYARTSEAKAYFIDRMRRDGLTAPFQWYCSMTKNIQFKVEQDIPAERLKIDRPVLFIGCTDDGVCRTDLINIPVENGLLPNLTVKEIESGHWSPMEKPLEMGSIIAQFLNDTAF